MFWIDATEVAEYFVLVFLSPKRGKTKQNKKSNLYERLALLVADKKIINYCH